MFVEKKILYSTLSDSAYIYGGVVVLELDSHPDHNMGPDPCTLSLSKDPSHRS